MKNRITMFLDGRLAMSLERRENVRHATLLFCAEGVNVRTRDVESEKVKMNKTTLFAICMALCVMPLMAQENDGPGRDTSGQRLRPMSLMSSSSSAALFPAPAASDVLIVVNSGGDIGREKWSGDVIKIPFTIDRYYGDIDKLILSKALPEKVKLTMYVYDVDDKSTSNPPEIDYVHIVNEKGDFTIGKPLYGENGKWTMVTLEFDTQCLNFPAEVGHKAQNELQVVVGEGGWVTAVNWFSIDLPAAPPILFCHGINTPSCLDTFGPLAALVDDLGIPYSFVQFKNNGNNSIYEYEELAWAVENACRNYHVDKVNLVCHSMGGLRARAYAEGANDVFKVLQIATPNGGSPVADFLINWKNDVLSSLAKKVSKGNMSPTEAGQNMFVFQDLFKTVSQEMCKLTLDPMGDPAIYSLQTTQMSVYNRNHRLNPNVEYGVIAGQVEQIELGPIIINNNQYISVKVLRWLLEDKIDETMKDILDATGRQLSEYAMPYFKDKFKDVVNNAFRNSDCVVPVTSAHTLVPTLPGSPLEGSFNEVWHSGLLQDGVDRTFAALRDKLVEKRVDSRTHAVASSGGGSSARSAQAMSVARVSAVTETMSNGYNEFGVLFDSSTKTCPFDIVSGNNAVVCLSSLGDATVSATLRSPSGVAYTQTAGNVAFSNDGTNVLCVLKNPEKGRWSVEFSAHTASSSVPVPWALVSYENESGVFFNPVLASDTVARGDSFSLRVSPRIGSVAASGSVDVYVTNPDGSQSVVSALESSDGGYVAEIPAPLVGNYGFSVTIDAISPQAFTRTAHLQGTVYAPGSSLSGTGSLVARDENANGMYDKLVFLGDATVSMAGTYRVFANLADAGGNPITEGLSTNVYCEAGTMTFEVPFDGAAIYRHGSCAGYVVSRVQLIEMGPNYEAVVNSDEDVANTTAYEYRQFEHAPIIVVDGGSETAVDADGDGIYDTLSVTLPLEADATALGSYEWSAVLMDSEGLALGTAAGNVSFSTADVATPITMTFAASDMAITYLEGPYYIKNIILWNYSEGASYTLNGGYETKAYRIVPSQSVTSRWPFAGIVDIDYMVGQLPERTKLQMSVSAFDGDGLTNLVATTIFGDGADGLVGEGAHRLSWNVAADYPKLNTTDLQVLVRGASVKGKVDGAYVETVGGVEWQYRIVNGESIICNITNAYCSAVPLDTRGNVSVPSILGGNPVVSIGDYAFSSCRAITRMSIPNSVTNIGVCSFGGCDALTDIRISGGNSRYVAERGVVFNKAKSQIVAWPSASGAITIPAGVTDIGHYAFFACQGLTSVVIPDGVVRIANTAFRECSALTAIRVSGGNQKFSSEGGMLFDKTGAVLIMCPVALDSVSIPGRVRTIGSEAFAECDNLRNVVLSDGVTDIESRAFLGCDALTNLTISATVASIGTGAFESCTALKSIVFYGNAPTVGGNAFKYDGACVVYVQPDSTGWGVGIPGVWNGVKIAYDPRAPLAVPTGLVASQGTSTDDIALSWNVVNAATAYEIWRSASDNSASAEKIGTSTTATYDDSSALPGTKFYYFIRATSATQSTVLSGSADGWKKLPLPVYNGYKEEGHWYNRHGIRGYEVTGTHYYYSLPAGATGFEVWKGSSADPTTSVCADTYYNTSTLDYYRAANILSSTPYHFVRAVNDLCKSDWLLIQK